MKTHSLVQGTPEWHAYRANHFNASDAPAMMGCSAYKTRSLLLREMSTGYTQAVDAATQRRFDDGHRFEALARPLAEAIIGEDLYPVVGSSGKYSASFDGLTMAEHINFEHKTLNADLRECMEGTEDAACLPLQYRVQMEQQHMVSGAERTLFMATKWDGDTLVESRHCWYRPNPALRQSIVDGWTQFAKDLADYTPEAATVAAVAAPQMGLPAVSITVNGSIALVDNLEKFGTALTAYIDRINKKPETDQDFADLEATVKTLKTAEEALDAAETNALAQTDSIDAMRRTVALYRETAKTNRLLVEKLVKAEKENRRTKIVGDAVAALGSHIQTQNDRARNYMPIVQANFQEVIKGLKSLDSMKDKVAGELARCKIEANAIADKIQFNLELLDENTEYGFLFPDVRQIVLKPADDFTALVTSRIADHKAAVVVEAAPALTHTQVVQQMPAAVRQAMAPQTTAAAPTMALGAISERLGFNVTSAFLATLGFEATTVKAAKLFHEEDFPAICRALIEHIESICEMQAA